MERLRIVDVVTNFTITEKCKQSRWAKWFAPDEVDAERHAVIEPIRKWRGLVG